MSDSNGASHDAGVERELRVRPCVVRTWCTREADHEGPCEEVPRTQQPPPDFGPKGKR